MKMFLKRKFCGYSIVEVLMAVMLLFLATSYLLGMFAAGRHYMLRSREYSTALLLARSKMEQLLAVPAESMASYSTGMFKKPFNKYSWKVNIEEYDSGLSALNLEVKAPSKVIATLRTLRKVSVFRGVSCDSYTNQVIYLDGKGSVLRMFSDGKAQALKSFSSSWRAGGVTGAPGRGFAWASSANEPKILYMRFSADSVLQSTSTYSVPESQYAQKPVFADIASDYWGSRLYCADIVNKAIRVAEHSGANVKWKTVSPVKEPLGKPVGLGTDEFGSILWIADGENDCLRLLHTDPTETVPAGAEKAQGIGWWDKSVSIPYSVRGLRGLAVNKQGSAVYTVDSACLYILSSFTSDGASWSKADLPKKLCDASPSGLACDAFRNAVFINTVSGGLWHFDVNSRQFRKLSD